MSDPEHGNDRLADELARLRAALQLPSVGISQIADLESLRMLIRRYPQHTRALLAELEAEQDDLQ